MMKPVSPWTEEKVELLRQRWSDGVSAPKIAEEFGPEFTKNSVIGKARRLNLPHHHYFDTRIPRTKKEPTPRKPAMIRVKATPISANREPPTDPKAWVPFMDLTSKNCRAILGRSYDDGLALFCPNPKDDTDSYCPHHAGIYYNPRSSR